MATAKSEIDKASEDVGGTAKSAASKGAEMAEQASGAVLEFERAVVDRSTRGAAEVGHAFADLVNEQTRHNVEAFQALSHAIDWNQVAKVQGELLRVSLERSAAFTQRYFEVLQAVMTAAVSKGKDQVDKAA